MRRSVSPIIRPSLQCILELRNPKTGAVSRGENLITVNGLDMAAHMMFKAVDQATKDGQQESPDLESRIRYFKYAHFGDGTNVTPSIQDLGLQRYLIDRDHPTCHGGASAVLDWEATDLDLIAGGFQMTFELTIEWSPDSADTSITEWCIGSQQDYFATDNRNLNHGTILYYLTGETNATMWVNCLW